MYHYFNFFSYAIDFIEANPTAKIVAWPCGTKAAQYVIFLPDEVENQRGNQTK
jgi:hypothetical protein